jgi:hypothetical protein
MSKDTEPALCARCSEPAVGYATIDGERYCHDDERSCYTAALWERGRQHAQGGVVRHPGRVYLEGTRIRVGAHLPQERLSVTLAREHVNDGHGGKYEPYCYRCQYHEAQADAATWEYLALTKRRVWLTPERRWWPLLSIGSDEFWRYTLCVGPVVIALWSMWLNKDRREWVARLKATMGDDAGQRDRDGQKSEAVKS